MGYLVKEIFYSIQGEGANAGRPAVFCRFAGCNLWSGREKDRDSAICRFCDTQFVGGTKYQDAASLTEAVLGQWPGHWRYPPSPFVVLTGGEPALQVDATLVASLRSRGCEVAIETNGTLPLPPGIHHVCVSPKAGPSLAVTSGDDLKLVFPQAGAEPHRYAGLDFRRFYLQPMDGPDLKFNEGLATAYCLEHPRWRISVQIHKHLGLR
jgi:7-carboxy-7-deazaguanine synthase